MASSIHPSAPSSDPEDKQAGSEWGDFSNLDDKAIRRAFIRKVYLILMIQLLVTFGLIALFQFTPAIRDYIQGPNGVWIYLASYVVFVITYIVLICSKRAARRFPLNIILLGILTLSLGYMTGMIAAFYDTNSVLIAVGITAFVCLGVTIFSFQTKYDFTSYLGVAFVLSLVLLGFGIVCIFTYSRILYTVYAALGAAVFAIFLAIDTQLIIGGGRHEISAEDHIFAALMLYIDIIYIFLFLLRLFGRGR